MVGLVPNLNQFKDTLRITETLIDNLDEEGLNELLGGSEQDIHKLFDKLVAEIHSSLHYNEGPIKTSSFDYLDKFSAAVEETFRVESFIYFIQSVLTDFIINWHHIEQANILKLYRLTAFLASRGSGKSFLFSKALPLWRMYRYHRPLPLEKLPRDIQLCETGMLFTHEMGLAEELLLLIKNDIETNDVLRDRLFNGAGDNWSKRSITCKNGARMSVKSFGSAARGRHPGWIVVDDFLIENVLFSKDFNDKIINYFYSVIENMVLRGGPITVVGTPFSSADLYAKLKANKKYQAFEYPAIYPDGSLLWPEFIPFSNVVEKKESQGNIIFSREILCKPISTDSTIFPYDMMAQCFSPSFSLIKNIYSSPVRFKKVVLGCDFARSANVGADFSTFITLGLDEQDCIWILNIYREKGKTFQEQIAVCKMLHSNFRYDIIFMEDNQMQSLFVDGAKEASLPVKGFTTGRNKNSLKEGWPSMAILFENRKFKIPRGDQYSIDMTDIVIAEFGSVAFTNDGLKSTSQHDDTCSSIWIGTKALQENSDILKFHD